MTRRLKYEDMKTVDCKKMLVLSLGAGTGKNKEKYNAATASKWGLLSWMYNHGATPLLDIFTDAITDIVDIHVSTMFQSLHNQKNYLRIQVRPST